MADAPADGSPEQTPLTKRQQAIEAQRKKVQQHTQRLKDMEARARTQHRRDDTRRKIIAGALALEHAGANKDSAFAKKLWALLDEYVVKPNERALFGLAPLPAPPAPPGGPGLKGEFPG